VGLLPAILVSPNVLTLGNIIRQKNTYSSLDVSMKMFQQLLKFCGHSDAFLDFVHGFGYKSSAEDENFNCFYRQSRGSPGEGHFPPSYGMFLSRCL
jgi:hypothetical protein